MVSEAVGGGKAAPADEVSMIDFVEGGRAMLSTNEFSDT